jgi:hypothetical protein
MSKLNLRDLLKQALPANTNETTKPAPLPNPVVVQKRVRDRPPPNRALRPRRRS